MNKSEKKAVEFLENKGFTVEQNDKGKNRIGGKRPDFIISNLNGFTAFCEFKNMESIMKGSHVEVRKIFTKLFSKIKTSGKQLKFNRRNLFHTVPNIVFLNCEDLSITHFDVRDLLRNRSTIPVYGSKSFPQKMRKTVDKFLISSIDMILLTNNNFGQDFYFIYDGPFKEIIGQTFIK
ncbi:MAG: hypothetical protein WD357_05905 [Gracilimonas sp.]